LTGVYVPSSDRTPPARGGTGRRQALGTAARTLDEKVVLHKHLAAIASESGAVAPARRHERLANEAESAALDIAAPGPAA
jgi:hypothetical protein